MPFPTSLNLIVRPKLVSALIKDVLPTPTQREALCNLLHYAFVELRLLGWAARADQAADLADAFHNLPKEMWGWGNFNWDMTRGMLEAYQAKWHGHTQFDYVAMLDESRRVA